MNLEERIIVIDGTDGSGKQTQAAELKKRLEQEGYKIYSRSFPNYESNSSALVKMYLCGEITKTPNEVPAEAASIFYAADRYITYKKEIEEVYNRKDEVILFDRYVSSNIIHQGAKKLQEVDGSSEEIKEKSLSSFIEWLDDFEHEKLKIPRPDLVIFLNVPTEFTIKMREQRANKITGGEKQDIHESDTNHLKMANKSGLMAAKLLNWKVIECVNGDTLRSIDDIADEIFNLVKNILN